MSPVGLPEPPPLTDFSSSAFRAARIVTAVSPEQINSLIGLRNGSEISKRINIVLFTEPIIATKANV
jgi:hypothetical protein